MLQTLLAELIESIQASAEEGMQRDPRVILVEIFLRRDVMPPSDVRPLEVLESLPRGWLTVLADKAEIDFQQIGRMCVERSEGAFKKPLTMSSPGFPMQAPKT